VADGYGGGRNTPFTGVFNAHITIKRAQQVSFERFEGLEDFTAPFIIYSPFGTDGNTSEAEALFERISREDLEIFASLFAEFYGNFKDLYNSRTVWPFQIYYDPDFQGARYELSTIRYDGTSDSGQIFWNGNAAELIKNGTATLNEIIAARDDILIYLLMLGVENKTAFNIMEKVRKGKGLTDEEAELMAGAGAPDWYIESCRRIKYLFPKGHAVAYVMMSVRIAYYKIHHPMAFYAASYSVKTEDVDYETMCKGPERASRELARITALGKEATAKEKNSLTTLELVLEMYARGITFLPIDIYASRQSRFIPTEQGILPPLMTLAGLGGNAAQGIVDARAGGEFISRQDFKERTKVSKTVMELFVNNALLKGLPETNQLTLFGL
jgi:DNA polymerase III alpha subunit (gram-positive type)